MSVEGTDIRTENEPEGMGEIFRWQGAEAQVMVLPRGPGGGLEGPRTAGRGEEKWREAWETCGATEHSCLT